VAHSHSLTKRTLEHLAGGIAERFGPHTTAILAAGAAVELGESFEVWFLGRSAISRTTAPLQTIARRTGYWHHQIRHNGKAVQYARSAPHGPGEEDWDIHAVLSSDLAGKIDDAITWIDAHVTEGDPLVRLLIVPAYFVTAFWLQDGASDRIVVVDMPAEFTMLERERIYTGQEFLDALAQERHAQGIPRRSSSAAPLP
jgi:hypothetical protein